MFEFKKLCNYVESLSAADRGILLLSQAKKVFVSFAMMDTDEDPITVLEAFVLGAVVSDGEINEKEFILIYPSLVKVFGDNVDYEAIKKSLVGKESKQLIEDYTKKLAKIISQKDESLMVDVVTLCLMILAIDGKISLKERRYVKNLCKQ